MINKNKFNQYGEKGLIPKGITIHNTGNTELSAKELFDWLNSDCKTSQGCHYLVDHNEVIEVMPLDYKVYHTGKGRDWAFHNTISIEICSNVDNVLYKKGQDKAISLITELFNKYGLTANDIYFHSDFAPIFCPCNILETYKTKQEFIRKEL